MIIQHNMAAQNAMTQFGITNDRLKKAAERLSSGYRVNRAADDAAVLAISEKKRAQIRGLLRAARNSQDGISLVQTGDGAMSQIGAMLHRMRELAVQSLNEGVYEPEDQAAMQMEFDELQSEIDRVNDQTEFNKKRVFEHYADNYSVMEGNSVWSQGQMHTIDDTNCSFTVKYVVVGEDGKEIEKEKTLTVSKGTYTTQELMDEMDDVITEMGDEADGLYLEYTDEHICNMVLQNGKEIKDVSGGLSYLFFDSYGGNKSGALIGTTIFFPGDPLVVKAGENDQLHFRVEYFDGSSQELDIKVEPDGYSQKDMIKYLNDYEFADGKKLADYGIKASEYGEASIQIGGDEGIITGLKGNMFAIDANNFDSVFYDNTKYGSVNEVPAVFTGGDVLNASDINVNKFEISSTNDTLRLRVNDGQYETIKLDAGSYYITDMVTELQSKLNEKGLDVKVTYHTVTGGKTPNGNTNYKFSGLTLTTNEVGKKAKIEFDVPGSSAYDTLFVERKYTDQGRTPTNTSGYYTTSLPSVTGGGEFNSSDHFPLTLDSSNNSFILEVTEQGEPLQSKKITLTEKTYQSLKELTDEITARIGDQTDYAGKIRAYDSGNKICVSAVSGNNMVTKINVAKDGINSGYDLLFAGEVIEYPTSTKITVGLNAPQDASGKITLTDQNNKMYVDIEGEKRTVTITAGTYTPEKLVELLNASTLKGEKTESSTSRSSGTYYGKTVTNTTTNESGKTTPCSNPVPVVGTGGKSNGSTQVKDGTPGSCQLGGTLGTYTKIDSTNNQFTININGKSYTVTLNNSTGSGYTQAGLAKELEDRLKEKTSEANQVKVDVSGGHLRFTTVAVGEGKSVNVTGCTCSFLSSVNATKTKGNTSVSNLRTDTYPITLTSTTNAFTIKIDGKAETVNLTAKKYDSINDIASELNTKLSGKGVAVTWNGSNLKFERTKEGSGSVSLDLNNSGTAGKIIFKNSPASVTWSPLNVPKATDTTNGTVKYTVTVGGNSYTATLVNKDKTKEKTITAADLTGAVWKLNDSGTAKKPADFGFSVSASGNFIKFTTTATDGSQSISLTEKRNPIVRETPTVTASLVKDAGGKVTGIALQSTIAFTAKPFNHLAVLQPKSSGTRHTAPSIYAPQNPGGKCSVTTRRPISMPQSIIISDDNNTLQFTYQYHNVLTKAVDIKLDNGTYSRAQLQKALQQKLDAVLEEDPAYKGQGLTVKVDDQITLESKKMGRYTISSLNGGFYKEVMMGTTVRTVDQKTAYRAGKPVVDDVYIAGRKDIRNQSTKIYKDINDELNIDLTINGNVTTLKMKLDPGTYNSDELVKQIQGKLSQELKKAQLPENMILAGVGVYNTGVSGANDKNSLFFYLNKKLDLEPGSYGIDGLTGKALFSIFYKTDGDPVPAYVTGTKDISGGVEIQKDANELSIDVDGKTYKYEIPAGTYNTASKLVDALNTAIKDADDDSFLKASLSGNMLKLSYTKLGEHKIGNIQGSAKLAMFYKTEGRYDEKKDEWLQTGANDGQGIKLDRYSMSTLAMGINSITISKRKYADKALVRIDDALKHLGSVRSKYGALENRLEYAYNADSIAAENTQSSESRDRDTDMASEMVEYAKSQILQQMGVSMLSQANQNTQSVLALLR